MCANTLRAIEKELPTKDEFTGGHAVHFIEECLSIWMQHLMISWTPSTSHDSICFGFYIVEFPSQLAKVLLDECGHQLLGDIPMTGSRRQDMRKIRRPEVDLKHASHGRGLLLSQVYGFASAVIHCMRVIRPRAGNRLGEIVCTQDCARGMDDTKGI
jgi:hypothetical protein